MLGVDFLSSCLGEFQHRTWGQNQHLINVGWMDRWTDCGWIKTYCSLPTDSITALSSRKKTKTKELSGYCLEL